MMKKIRMFSLLIFVVISCEKTEEIDLANNDNSETPTESDKDNGTDEEDDSYPFFAYNFGGLEELAPAEQIRMLKKHGYDGITLKMAKAEDVAQYQQFVDEVEKTADFKIYSVFVRYNFADSETDRNRWKVMVDLIQGQDIDLWFIFGKNEPGIDDAHVEEMLREVVEYAAGKNVPVTLYPHSWCYFETAEQSLPMVQKINHPNLKLAVHTYHELKGGNTGRLAQVVHNVKDYISFVTLAGAAKTVDMTSRASMDRTTIQPLEDGAYNLGPFLKALKNAGYKGPVGYINFKFDKDLDDYLPKSLQTWEALKKAYL